MTTFRHTIDIGDNPCEGRASVILLECRADISLAGNTVRDDGTHFILEFGSSSRRKPMKFATVVAAVRKLKRLAAAQERAKKKLALPKKSKPTASA
jgi:hypothetical protein